MNKLWHDTAWDDYIDWQLKDRKTLRRINALNEDALTLDIFQD
ncbi:MAG: type II toxin-antitoxin system YoeB family toxin [Oscillospiraceae bacterium]|nr:type II toxin-antitoxin system YoeB family toxin [Oscillospiraceae bacterium]